MDFSEPSLPEIEVHDPQEEIAHLTEINKQLKEELEKVKQEFSQTVNVLPNIESLYNENNTLKKTLMDVQSRGDDLQKRLNIALQTNNEILSSKESAKSSAAKEYESRICDLQIELSTVRTENENMKTNFLKQVKNSESQLYNIQSDNSVLQSGLTKVLKASEIRFNKNFQNVNELIDFLKQPPVTQSTTKEGSSDREDEEKELIERTLKNLKSKLSNEKQKVKTLQIGVIKLKKKADNEDLKNKQEILQLQDQIKQRENEIERLTLLNQQKLIVKPPPKLRNQFVQVSNIIEDTESESLRHELASANAELNERATNVSMLKMQLESANNQIRENENSKQMLIGKLKTAANETDSLQQQLSKTRKQNEKLSKEVEDALTKLAANAVESTMPKERLEGELARLKLDLKNSEKTIDHLESLLNDQKGEIVDLSNTKEKLIALIEKQGKIFNVMNQMITEKQNPTTPKSVEKIVTVEPQFEWHFGNLPAEIIDIVAEISQNDSLSIESRVKSVFIVINKYIENQLNSREKEKESLVKSIKDLSKQYEEYKKLIVDSFDGEEENIAPEDAPNLITKYIVSCKKLTNEILKLKSENENLFTETACEDFGSIIQLIHDLNESTQKLASQLKEEKKKRSSMRTQISKVLSTKEKELESKTETLTKMNDSSRKQITQLQSQIEKLQEQNKKLIEQLTSLTKSEKTEKQNKEEYEEFLKSQQLNSGDNDDTSQALQLSKETAQMSFQIEDLSGQLNSLNKAVEKWKEAAKNAQDEVAIQQKRISDITQENEAKADQMIKEFQKEKEDLVHQIQELANKLGSEQQNHKDSLQSLTDSLSQAHQRLDEATQEINSHKFEIEKVNLSANSRVEAAERSKKLIEAQLKAQILSIDSNHTMQIEEEKQRSESEKRNLIEGFIKNFKSFADIREKLDENSFNIVVKKVRVQMEKNQKTENAIRKLIKAKDEESTEDALTQFIIRMHPQFQSSH